MTRTAVLGILALVLAAVFVRLGFWQLDRAEQRARANDEVRIRLSQPPLALAGALDDGADSAALAWRRVTAVGTWLPELEVVMRNRTSRGTPGVELLTPLQLDTGGTVWVNRGWLPSPDASTVDATRWRASGHTRMTGWLRPPEPGERAAAKARIVFQPKPSRGGLPRLRDMPELSGGPHVSYAIQWFAFAAIAVFGFGAYAWARARGGAADPSVRPPSARAPRRSDETRVTPPPARGREVGR